MHRFRPSLNSLRRHLHEQSNLDTAGSLCSRLTTRSVVRFAGPDTFKFLQGLLTNDVHKFEGRPGERTCTLVTPNLPTLSVSPMYAALLTPQGRFLYDFFLYRPPPPEEKLNRNGSGPGPISGGEIELFADVDRSVLDELLDTLRKYRLRSKVEIENVAEDFACWQRYGAKLVEKASSSEEPEAASVGYGGTFEHNGQSASRGNAVGWQWFKDPRLDCLGYRGIFPSSEMPPLVEADKETGEEHYLLWRLEKGVAEGSSEIPKGEAIPLEYNLTGLNAISFDKGCYVGQELIARTHHRGVIRKRLLPLRFLDADGNEMNAKVAPASEVISTTSRKTVGIINTALGCRGMGLLRLEEALKDSASLAIKGQEDVKVETMKPEWWPVEWMPEHRQQSAAA